MKFIDVQGVSKEMREVKVVDKYGRVVSEEMKHTGNANYTDTTSGVVFHNVAKTVRRTLHSLKRKNVVHEYLVIQPPKSRGGKDNVKAAA